MRNSLYFSTTYMINIILIIQKNHCYKIRLVRPLLSELEM